MNNPSWQPRQTVYRINFNPKKKRRQCKGWQYNALLIVLQSDGHETKENAKVKGGEFFGIKDVFFSFETDRRRERKKSFATTKNRFHFNNEERLAAGETKIFF